MSNESLDTSGIRPSAPPPTFALAKSGDQVYSLLHGEGIVRRVSDTSNGYPLEVSFDGRVRTYTLEGNYYDVHKHPVLFWAKPEIIAPPRPKHKVTKTQQVWVNHYEGNYDNSPGVHTSEEQAKAHADRSATAVAVLGTLTYEIEE